MPATEQMSNRSNRSRIILILALGFALRLVFIFLHDEVNLMNEMSAYDKAAVSLLEGEGFHPGGPGGRDMRSLIPPGYSFFLMLVYGIFGHSFLAARIMQSVLSVGSIYVMYRIALLYFDGSGSLLVAWIMALYPQNIIMSDLLLTETVFTFIFLTASYFLFRGTEHGGLWSWILAGILFGFAALTRSIIFLFIPLFTFIVLVLKRSFRDTGKFMVVIICMVIIILPWTYRNWTVHKKFLLINSKAGIDFYLYNHPRNITDIIFASPDHEEEKALVESSTDEVDLNQKAMQKSFEWMRHHPGLFVIKGVRNVMGFWGMERTFYTHVKGNYYGKLPVHLILLSVPVLVLPYPILMLFAVPGMFGYRRNDVGVLFMKICFIYFMIIAFAAYSWSRQRYPITPFLVFFAVYAWNNRAKNKGLVKSFLSGPARWKTITSYMFLLCAWVLEIFVAFESLRKMF